jgi:AbrB family looped-hinge helix DNA binding protein
MVEIVELIVRVDSQGRTVLPKNVRQALEIEGETELVCRVVGDKIILQKFDVESIHKAFTELGEIAPSLEIDTIAAEGEDKYVDREYALHKIGL